MEFSRVYPKRMGTNPAQVDRETGELFVNPDVWPYLPESFKTWILLHEEGHLKGGANGQPTADELLADKYAFENYVGTEKQSLRKSVLILHKTLPKHNQQQWNRIITMYARALEYDYRKFGNKAALKELEAIRGQFVGLTQIPNKPFFSSKKSNFAPIVVAGIISLVSTIVGGGAKIYSDNKTRTYQKSVAEVYNLQRQTTQSNQMASSMIKENGTIYGVSIYMIVILLALITLAVVVYLKKKK